MVQVASLRHLVILLGLHIGKLKLEENLGIAKQELVGTRLLLVLM